MSENQSSKTNQEKVHRRSFFAALGGLFMGAITFSRFRSTENNEEISVSLHQDAVKREKRKA